MKAEFGILKKGMDVLNTIFRNYPEINEIWVFGSRAKDTYNERSDLDLVIINPVDRKTLGKLWMEINSSDFPMTVDLQVLDHIRNESLKAHISRVGKAIYVKNSKDFSGLTTLI
jgi:predicted nucleotidyltransferase